MTLIGAVKTGKPFRRKAWANDLSEPETSYIVAALPGSTFQWEDDGEIATLCPVDVLATDWEIKP